jgi:hypothetical protein
MRAGNKMASFQTRELSDAESQALAVFRLNGVEIAGTVAQLDGEDRVVVLCQAWS